MQAVLAAAIIGSAGLLFLTGCGPDSQSSRGGGDSVSSRATGGGAGSSQRLRQAEFLNRIRQSDPQYQTIQKAVLNERNELALILNRTVELNSIPNLMRAMLTQMAKEFPDQDLTIIAYAPTDPPARMGTGHLDARTRAMTYTPETKTTTY